MKKFLKILTTMVISITLIIPHLIEIYEIIFIDSNSLQDEFLQAGLCLGGITIVIFICYIAFNAIDDLIK